MKKIYIFPRYSGNENSDWYIRLQTELRNCNSNLEIIPMSFPNWDKPDIDNFLEFIVSVIPENDINSDTYFIGHSIGCKAALLFLNALQIKNIGLKIGGLMCVAGWWTIDKPWLQLKPWINYSIEFKNIKKICSHNILCLLSDNDPFTSDFNSNMQAWKNLLDAKIVIVPKAKHFNQNDGFEEIKTELLNFIK